jgi:photosystem II stability/assembly factor-like uncharacterized protein
MCSIANTLIEVRMRKPLFLLVTMVLGASAFAQSTLRWEPVRGPYSPLLSYARQFAVDKIGTIYVSTFSRGIYRSTDNGDTWLTMHKPIENGFVNAIAVDSNNNVYAATRLGLFMSTDRGLHWAKILDDKKFSWNTDIGYITISPLNEIFVDYEYGHATSYWSKIGEFNWDSINAPGDGIARIEQSGRIISRKGDYYSDDHGATWTMFEPDTITPNIIVRGRRQVYNGSIVHVVTDSGLYRSTDSGITYTYNDFKGRVVGVLPRSQSGIMFAHIYNYSSEKDTVFYSHDQGLTWQLVPNPPTDSLLRDVIFVASNRILAIWGASTYSSEDSGLTWRYCMYGSELLGNCFTTGNGNFAIIARNTINISTNFGETWTQCPVAQYPVEYSPHKAAIDKDGVIYYGYYSRGQIYRSMDTGNTWTALPVEAYAPEFAIASDNTVFVAADTSVYTSFDKGASWYQVEIDADTNYRSDARSIAISPDGSLWVGTSDALYHSVDTGRTFKRILNDTNRFVGGVVKILFDERGRIYLDSYGDIYVSIDTAKSWTTFRHPGTLPFMFKDVEYCRGNLLVTSEDLGIIRTSDWGQTWIDETAGTDIHFTLGSCSHKGYVFLATSGGLFRSRDTSLHATVNHNAQGKALPLKMYPNPATDAVGIEVVLEAAQEVSLFITNIDGKLVRHESFGNYSPGKYLFGIDVHDLLPGYYLAYINDSNNVYRRVKLIKL